MNSVTKHYRHLKSALRKRAKERGVPCTITRTELRKLFATHSHCEICGVEFVQMPNHDAAPSVERVVPAFGYVLSNVTIICRKCNSTKGELDALGEFKDSDDEYKRKILLWAQKTAEKVRQAITNESA